LSAFIYLSVDILLQINLLEKHRRNGKKQPQPVSRDRPKRPIAAPRDRQKTVHKGSSPMTAAPRWQLSVSILAAAGTQLQRAATIGADNQAIAEVSINW
jgi:hypothetical protein